MSRQTGSWAILGVAVVFVTGSAVHSLYHAVGEPLALAPLLPVNESPWEHLKMAYLPTIAWALVGLRWFDLPRERVPAATAGAVVTTMAIVLGLFYGYTTLLGTNLLVVDVLTFAVAVAGGMAVARRFLETPTLDGTARAGVAAVLFVGAVFAVATFAPPHLHPFRDSLTGTYGV